MVTLSLFIAALHWAAAAIAANVSTAIGASDATVGLSPFGSWFGVGAPGEFAGGARFLLSNANLGVITYVFSTPSTTFEFWGYQRSDGGLYSISFDGGATSQIDVFNKTSTGSDLPKRLFFKTGLSNAVHSFRIVNLLDTRVSPAKFGQMNVDHFVLTGNPPGLIQAVAPTFPTNSFIAEGPLGSLYHAALSLGAHSKTNGGDGGTVEVLLDSGAAGETWVIWNQCTLSVCSGHSTYQESTSHFTNLTIQDNEVFGSGGPSNTISAWRVNDTFTFSNVTLLSTTFGAASSIPTSGETLDGNFNIAKSFCAGAQCANYPSFIEAMFQSGTIHAPLNSTDQPAAGVSSKIDVGGIDRNKFTGSMNWIPLTQNSMWTHPSAQRFVKGSGNSVNATAQFTHTSLVFDTGSNGLLGLPTNDWNTLSTLVGVKTVNGNVVFPCTSEITFNFRGTQNRNYTYSLVDTTTNNGGFCNPTASDFGDTVNWLAGSPFLDNYYTAFYYGNAGIGSTLGFGAKNLAASAATARVVVGTV